MNCQELARLLDERDLDRLPATERGIVEAHLADCPDCARDHDLHRRLNALPVPSLGEQQIAGWRAVAMSGARRAGRQRSRLVVIATLVAVAAAAALLVVQMNGTPRQPAQTSSGPELLAADGQSSASEASTMDASGVPGPDSRPSSEEKQVEASSAVDQPRGSFTVLVMPLQIETEHPAARAMGEEYYARLLEQLRVIPGLKLVNAAGHADFRLRVTSGYGKVPERFGSHEQWQQNLVAEAARPGSAGLFTVMLGFSNNPDCGRISPADLANAWSCTPAGMVDLGIQQLRRNVFPPDAAAARQLQARFLDTSLPQGLRRQALADLIELRQKAPGAMDPELIRVIINDAIANAPYPAQRVDLWRALRGQSSDMMVRPLIQNLRREGDDTVRLEIVGILAAEFSADAAARAELELVAKRDVKMLVRKVADRAISGEAAWRSYVVSTVKDANLPLAQRFEPLAWMAEARVMRPADTRIDAELNAIARQLLEEGEGAALAEVLTGASKGPTRPVSGVLQIAMSSLQHPAVADFLIAIVNRQADFSTFSLLGRHRADPRIEAKLRDIAANHADPDVRQLAAAQLDAR